MLTMAKWEIVSKITVIFEHFGTTINTSHLLKLGAGPLGPILDLPLDLMQVEGLAA